MTVQYSQLQFPYTLNDTCFFCLFVTAAERQRMEQLHVEDEDDET